MNEFSDSNRLLIALFMYGAKSADTKFNCPPCAPLHTMSDKLVVSELEDFLNGKIEYSQQVEDMLESLEIKQVSVRDYIYKVHLASHLKTFKENKLSLKDLDFAINHGINFYYIISNVDKEHVGGLNKITSKTALLHIFPFQYKAKLEGKLVSTHFKQVLEIINMPKDMRYFNASEKYFYEVESLANF